MLTHSRARFKPMGKTSLMHSETDRNELSALFKKFLPAEMASRFSELLAMKPERWKKIYPWRVWELVEAGSILEWKDSVQSLLASPRFAIHSESPALVLRCGHDRPSLERTSLSKALIGESAVLEGFISVLSGELGIVINHDGEICVLSK